MVRTFKILLLVLLFTSCNSNKNHENHENYYLEINNKELTKQIIEYKHFIDSLCQGRSFVLTVYCCELNDSANKYVISKESSAFGFPINSYNFKCKVEDFDVLFIMVSGLVNSPDYGKTDLNFFKVKQPVILEDIKKYFPEEYKYFIKNGNFPPPDMFEPEILHLTFVRDKLVKKIYRRGSFKDVI